MYKLYFFKDRKNYNYMVMECANCGELVAEWECDDEYVPYYCMFDNSENHKCS